MTRPALPRALSGVAQLVVLARSVACGSSEPAGSAAPPPSVARGVAPEGHGGHGAHGGGHGGDGSPVVPAPTLYAVQSGPLGVVLTDGSGHLVYRSDADRADPPTSACADACAETWIPLTAVADQELDLAGVRDELVGRLQRADGSSQPTLAGWPLYRHRDDDDSLADAGRHGAEGTWFVVTPAGEKATPA